ncbi:phosphatase PAP2 family protein [Caulobacter sp. KR2-114]|uniref:phosphatase PAP2 family protein n=1 Tax=Caulobacter sp. KR2-114 TaxID=3400912 RepID=UPI003C0B1A90
MRLRGFSLILAASAALLGLTAQGHAADKPALAFLTEADVEPSHLLPPPPVDGSSIARAELAELHRIGAVTTPAEFAIAKWDNDHEDGTIFQSAIAPGFDLDKLPATAKLLREVRTEEAIAASKAKDYFKRNRPWIVDGSLKTCSRDEKPQSSYPSGHTTMGFAMAVVLTKAMPELSGAIMSRARDYAYHRMECGMHYRADIVGGETLGVAVAAMLLKDPRFQADLDAARAELKAAGLTGQAG